MWDEERWSRSERTSETKQSGNDCGDYTETLEWKRECEGATCENRNTPRRKQWCRRVGERMDGEWPR